MPPKTSTRAKKTVKPSADEDAKLLEEKWQSHDHAEHILVRPDTYVGSTRMETVGRWVINEDHSRMEWREVEFCPAIYKIFDEILVNSSDQVVRSRMTPGAAPTKNILVNIDRTTGVISVANDGDGIDVALHPKTGVHVPEMIFGMLLTSSNYNDAEKRIVGGRNGYGAKLTNIFSSNFQVCTIDGKRKLKYQQAWRNNMRESDPPVITPCKTKPITSITFQPDYARFGMTGLTDDMYWVMVSRVFDICAVTPNDVVVYLNNTKLPIKTFQKYVELYLGDAEYAYEKVNERWDIAVATTPISGYSQVSFVNGINTIRGGKHVEYVTGKIVENLVEIAEKKTKMSIKAPYVKENIMVFVNSVIENPSFDSQSKEVLTTPYREMGSRCDISDSFFSKTGRIGIIDHIMESLAARETAAARKTDGKRKQTIYVKKLDDATFAGTGDKSHLCTLILTEGDSAKTTAISGLKVVGREYYGVFPLKGKLLNVKDLNIQKINDNEEIANIKKILGLELGKIYTPTERHNLRYGRVMIMADQDSDGIHIRGLVINLFHSLWRSLLAPDMNFLVTLVTPIVKVTRRGEVLSFYTETDYENWKATADPGWEKKYYKGLGTSTAEEARDYFAHPHIINYIDHETPVTDEAINLAFNKTRADDRKEWLQTYDRNRTVNYGDTELTYRQFVHDDLIHFANANLMRSIPSLVDGLKVSQRKILFCCFKRKLTKEIRVAQLGGYVSENAAYHHGEVSLVEAITSMARDFVGSNNINLLFPSGQFGSRILGGKDAASPRYISTYLEEITRCLFSTQDDSILKYLDDDGFPVEPEFYLPVIPFLLVNGTDGIATGFSTDIQPYNPRDLIDNMRRLIRGDPLAPLTPWYRGHRGVIEQLDDNTFISRGIYNRISATEVQITELPVGVWTGNYKDTLGEMMLNSTERIRGVIENYNDIDVEFTVKFNTSDYLDSLLESTGADPRYRNRFEQIFGMTRVIRTSNMCALDENCRITKYASIDEIQRDFYNIRRPWYEKRRRHLINLLESDLPFIESRVRFIVDTLEGRVDIRGKSDVDVMAEMVRRRYAPEGDVTDGLRLRHFAYLLDMPIRSLTESKKTALEREYADHLDKIAALKKMTAEKMWLSELDQFETAYREFSEKYDAKMNVGAASAGRVTGKKTRGTSSKPRGTSARTKK